VTAVPGAEYWLGRVVIGPDVLELRPDYRAVVVVAEDLDPGPSDSATDRLLAAAECAAQAVLGGRRPEDLPEVAAWRDAYRRFGAKPQRTRPSVEALLRRIDAGLPRIDRITDVYNAVSVQHLLPVGGENLDAYRGPARLVRASGDEPFDTVKNGAPAIDHPSPGEVIWRDDAGVTCRSWNWRQCQRTLITTETTSAIFILDGLEPGRDRRLHAAQYDLLERISTLHPRARLTSQRLPTDHDTPSVIRDL
jgi:DNA/RNA-binding domain of Phe-tRNA-synthetase-like protein